MITVSFRTDNIFL